MANNKTFRKHDDLIAQIADLQERISYLETSQRLNSSSIDSGQLVLRNGDLVVVDGDGNPTLTLTHGSQPSIIARPSAEAGAYGSRIFSWTAPSTGPSLEERIEDSNGVRDGGKLLLNKYTSYLSHQPAVGAECYVAVGAHTGGYTEHFRFRGRWVTNDGFDNQDGVICGYAEVEAGFGAVSFAFPYEFDKIPIVLYSLYNVGTAVAHDLSALSTTGFTVAWATGTTAKTIGWVAFRR